MMSIAKKLCLRVKTISSYRASILLKTRMKNNEEITHYAGYNKLMDGSEPSGSPSCHRTNTGTRIRQTATRVSDRNRFRRPVDGITVVDIRERRQQAPGRGDRRDVPGPDIPGPIGRKGENYAADSCGNRSGCRRCNPVAD